jgi:hypothetical protein
LSRGTSLAFQCTPGSPVGTGDDGIVIVQ